MIQFLGWFFILGFFAFCFGFIYNVIGAMYIVDRIKENNIEIEKLRKSIADLDYDLELQKEFDKRFKDFEEKKKQGERLPNQAMRFTEFKKYLYDSRKPKL